MNGKLFIVATPIGNLSDITLRALETLKLVDRIVAEDTRVTSKLLAKYSIKKPLLSLRARSARAQFERVAQLVEDGEVLAYTTDAGTPGISDPGSLLASLVREKCGDLSVIPIPGASALTTALSGAGVHTESFTFLGFLPQKKGRQKALNSALEEPRTVVIYESSHRIIKLLKELQERAPMKVITLAHELTKMHEHIASGTPADLLRRVESKEIPPLGEFVVILGA